jgi:hypothetical protein
MPAALQLARFAIKQRRYGMKKQVLSIAVLSTLALAATGCASVAAAIAAPTSTPTTVPPTPSPTLVENPTWDADIGPMFKPTCGTCHNNQVLSGGLNMWTYADLMKGGTHGAAIVPGDSAGSLVVQIQSAQHYFNLAPAKLELVKRWIDAGAPEK